VHDEAEDELWLSLFPGGSPSRESESLQSRVAAMCSDPTDRLRSSSCAGPRQSHATAGWFKGNFSAALLAGGRSIRMGRDKAQIPVSWQGATVPLRIRQLRVLESLEPKELFYSGPAQMDDLYDARIVVDEWSDAGPLNGIASCLKQTTTHLLLCLAVDAARVQAAILLKLLGKCRAGQGVVPRIGEQYEPLVAVYPKRSLRLAINQIEEGQLRLQDFVRRLLSEHLIIEYSVSDDEIPLFANWNTPEDVAPE
jgi:molybdopterin-guanine dinucleotide biosynthesis protein A